MWEQFVRCLSGHSRALAAASLAIAITATPAAAENRTIPEPTGVAPQAPQPFHPDEILKNKRFHPRTPEERLAKRLAETWAGKRLRRGTTAIYVVDTATGKPIFAVHEKEKLNPASNVKLFSTAAALDILGPDWRYATRLFGPAPNRQGLADGDLYILGTGDPTLRTSHLDELVEQVKAAGIKRVSGDVVIGSATIRDAVSRARVKVTITGENAGEPPTVSYEPQSDLFEVAITAKSLRRKRGRVKVSVDWKENADQSETKTGRYVITIAGGIRKGRHAKVWRAVSRRATFTAHTLRAKLIEAGVEVRGNVRVEDIDDVVAAASGRGYLPIELARHESAPMSKLLARVNKPSNNYLADRVLMTAGAAVYGGIPNLDKGLKAMQEWLARDAGIDPNALTIDTGSGLSYHTEITAEQIVHVLRAGAGLTGPDPDGDDAQNAPVFLKSLAVAGRDGTLRRRFRRSRTRGRMVGKTGTLTSVIALSGFVKDGRSDDGLCFSIVTNGNRHKLRNRVRHEHEVLVEAMTRYLRERRQVANK